MTHIAELDKANEDLMHQAAALLHNGFQEMAPNAWPDMESALKEVHECMEDGRILLGALNERGELMGWIGGIPQYDGNVWELHPLVVAQKLRRRGIGRALVLAFEAEVKIRGGITLTLGTDDEMGLTSLAGKDLYQDTFGQIARIQNIKNHPFEFYQKLGYQIVGVLPDANGLGKPDIYMAKRVSSRL